MFVQLYSGREGGCIVTKLINEILAETDAEVLLRRAERLEALADYMRRRASQLPLPPHRQPSQTRCQRCLARPFQEN